MSTVFPWFELLVPDAAAAAEALGDVLGWTLLDGPYRRLVAEGRPVAGLLVGADVDPHWIAHVRVPDVEALVRRVRFVQGEVIEPPTPLEGVGLQALVADPAGAVLAPLDGVGGPGPFPFAVLCAPRKDLGLRVVRTLLDWREASGGPVSVLAASGVPVALVVETDVVGPQWAPVVDVPDVDEVVEDAEDLGGVVLVPAIDVAGVGRVAVVALDAVGVVGLRAAPV